MAKSLKDQNQLSLWVILLANVLVLYAVVHGQDVLDLGMSALKDPKRLPAVGLGLVLAAVVNRLLDRDTKARLVFFRWNEVLPSHRAFSFYLKNDGRIDRDRLLKHNGGRLPTAPLEQYKLWYRWYSLVADTPRVQQVHRDFLLFRDVTSMAALLFVVFAAIALYSCGLGKTFGYYIAFLAGQFVLARRAAATAGVEFVTTVLSDVAARDSLKPSI